MLKLGSAGLTGCCPQPSSLPSHHPAWPVRGQLPPHSQEGEKSCRLWNSESKAPSRATRRKAPILLGGSHASACPRGGNGLESRTASRPPPGGGPWALSVCTVANLTNTPLGLLRCPWIDNGKKNLRTGSQVCAKMLGVGTASNRSRTDGKPQLFSSLRGE